MLLTSVACPLPGGVTCSPRYYRKESEEVSFPLPPATAAAAEKVKMGGKENGAYLAHVGELKRIARRRLVLPSSPLLSLFHPPSPPPNKCQDAAMRLRDLGLTSAQ